MRYEVSKFRGVRVSRLIVHEVKAGKWGAGSCHINNKQWIFEEAAVTNINSIHFNEVAETADIIVVAWTNDWNWNWMLPRVYWCCWGEESEVWKMGKLSESFLATSNSELRLPDSFAIWAWIIFLTPQPLLLYLALRSLSQLLITTSFAIIIPIVEQTYQHFPNQVKDLEPRTSKPQSLPQQNWSLAWGASDPKPSSICRVRNSIHSRNRPELEVFMRLIYQTNGAVKLHFTATNCQ